MDSIGQPVTWLSGEIATFFNKIGPVIWLAVMARVFYPILWMTPHVPIASAFGPLVIFALLATGFLFWQSMRMQRVGYTGRELVISNYSRQERIPFDLVEAVEPVWWYRRRMVRIRLRTDSSFGQVIYYIPKWASIRCLWVAPEKELQALIARR